jgi:hypothetical protein
MVLTVVVRLSDWLFVYGGCHDAGQLLLSKVEVTQPAESRCDTELVHSGQRLSSAAYCRHGAVHKQLFRGAEAPHK